jgi:ssDNA-binding Zn-finger/Zn-ribbon topoisomerase 1
LQNANAKKPKKERFMKMICPSCRYVGEARTLAKGSRKTEILLWCCLCLPGLFYTMWRNSTEGQYTGCPQCHAAEIRPMKRKEWKHYQRTGELPA